MPKAVLSTTYQKLLSRVKAEIEAGRKGIEHVRALTYWNVGKMIHEDILKNAKRAGYGEQLCARLGKDLGVGKRTVERAIQFHREYPIASPVTQLSWSHYIELLSVSNKLQRKQLEERAVAQKLSKSELRAEIAAVLKGDQGDQAAQPPAADKAPARGKLSLHYTRGRLGVYRTVIMKGLQVKAKERYLDLGFSVYQEGVEGIARREHGDIVEAAGEARVRAAGGAGKDDLYTYKAFVEQVIDGDTVWVDVALGFGLFVRQKLRLRGIDAPEADTEPGKTAKGFLKRTLESVEFIIIRTHGSDKYDRYLVDIFYRPGESDAAKVAADGTYLNQEMLDQGLAGLYLAEG